MNFKDIFLYILGILLSIIGFFIVQSYNTTNASLASINSDIIDMRLKITEISLNQMTDARVKELIHIELSKRGN